MEKEMMENLIIPNNLEPKSTVTEKINEFLKTFEPREVSSHAKLVLCFDEKSGAYYFICHLDAKSLAESCDLEATLDGGNDDEIYKLNRDIYEDQSAFKAMEDDALSGRSFEDLVVEYDTSYRKDKPLKVYGGQHRMKCNGSLKLDTKLLFESVDDYDFFDHWASNSAGVR